MHLCTKKKKPKIACKRIFTPSIARVRQCIYKKIQTDSSTAHGANVKLNYRVSSTEDMKRIYSIDGYVAGITVEKGDIMHWKEVETEYATKERSIYVPVIADDACDLDIEEFLTKNPTNR